jgi:hypothetical protein
MPEHLIGILTAAWCLTTRTNFRSGADINDCRLCFLNNRREIRQRYVLCVRVLCVHASRY